MQRILQMALIGMVTLGAAGAAVAQQPEPPVPVDPNPAIMEQGARQPNPKPLTSLFGLPVGINAPVSRPYCNCAFQDFGGQPIRSRTALANEEVGIGH